MIAEEVRVHGAKVGSVVTSAKAETFLGLWALGLRRVWECEAKDGEKLLAFQHGKFSKSDARWRLVHGFDAPPNRH